MAAWLAKMAKAGVAIGIGWHGSAAGAEEGGLAKRIAAKSEKLKYSINHAESEMAAGGEKLAMAAAGEILLKTGGGGNQRINGGTKKEKLGESEKRILTA